MAFGDPDQMCEMLMCQLTACIVFQLAAADPESGDNRLTQVSKLLNIKHTKLSPYFYSSWTKSVISAKWAIFHGERCRTYHMDNRHHYYTWFQSLKHFSNLVESSHAGHVDPVHVQVKGGSS